MKSIILYILTLFSLTACTSWDYFNIDEFPMSNSAHEIELYIDGGITSQLAFYAITIAKPGSYLNNTKPEYISDATVFITSQTDTIYFLSTDILDGKKSERPSFKTKDKVKADVGKSYTLTVIYNGKTYTATDSIVEVEPIDYKTIKLPKTHSNASSSDKLYFFSLNKHEFGYKTPNIWVWLESSMILEDNNYLNYGSLKSYSHRGAEPQGVFSTERINVASLGNATDSILTVKYSLSEKYYNYLRALFIETDWQESKFSGIPGNLPTNFSEGALGFFHVCDCSEKYISVQELLDLNNSSSQDF